MASRSAELIVVGLTEGQERAVSAAVEGIATIVASLRGLDRLAGLPASAPSQIVVAGIDADPERGFEAVRQLVAAQPDRPVIVLSESNDSAQVLRAMRAGARDYAVADAEMGEVIGAVLNLTRDRAADSGRIVSVLPVKGGVGATTVAANLAALARMRRDLRVVLVDLDVQMGDCLLFFDVAANYSIADVLRNMRRLDADLLRSSLAVHPRCGAAVLAHSDKLEESDDIGADSIGALLSFLKLHFDAVIVDGLRGFSDAAIAAIEASDDILVLLTQDVAAVKNARRCLDVVARLGVPDSKIHLALNRRSRALRPTPEMITETLGRPLDAEIGNDFPAASDALNGGRLLIESAPRSRVTTDLAALLPLLLGAAQEAEPRGVLSGLLAATMLGKKVRHAAR